MIVAIDDERNLRALARKFRGKIRTATSVAAGLELIRERQPRVVIVEPLPGDGEFAISAIPVIRDMAPGVTVIVYASLVNEFDSRRAWSAGANAYLGKEDTRHLGRIVSETLEPFASAAC